MNVDWITAFEALRSVYIDEAYSNIAINEALSKHRDASAGFVRTFVKGVLRDSIRLDYYIASLASNGLKGIKGRTRIVLRMGLYAIESLDSVPLYAACDEAVKLSKKVSKGTDRFVNAILRNFARRQGELTPEDVSQDEIKDNRLSRAQIKTVSLAKAFDEDFVRMLDRQYGAEECIRMLDGFNTAPELVIRTNTLKITRDELIFRLRAKGFEASACEGSETAVIVSGGSVVSDELFKEGLYSVQSLSSILSIEAFKPQKGTAVLDMCAAPGGKSAAMAELMGNEGRIVSLDIHKHRCELIEATCRRLGIDIVNTGIMDATKYVEAFAQSFDFVLCDAPCSGLGVISTKPEIKLKKRTDASELTGIQLAALENAYEYVRDGGSVMYSTCTVNKDENEGVVRSFAKRHPEAQIIENMTLMPYNNLIGFFYCIIKK